MTSLEIAAVPTAGTYEAAGELGNPPPTEIS